MNLFVLYRCTSCRLSCHALVLLSGKVQEGSDHFIVMLTLIVNKLVYLPLLLILTACGSPGILFLLVFYHRDTRVVQKAKELVTHTRGV